jgi:hypothetical protein
MKQILRIDWYIAHSETAQTPAIKTLKTFFLRRNFTE